MGCEGIHETIRKEDKFKENNLYIPSAWRPVVLGEICKQL